MIIIGWGWTKTAFFPVCPYFCTKQLTFVCTIFFCHLSNDFIFLQISRLQKVQTLDICIDALEKMCEIGILFMNISFLKIIELLNNRNKEIWRIGLGNRWQSKNSIISCKVIVNNYYCGLVLSIANEPISYLSQTPGFVKKKSLSNLEAIYRVECPTFGHPALS